MPRATMKKRDRWKGRKESLGKETDALDPDEHFDVIALLLELRVGREHNIFIFVIMLGHRSVSWHGLLVFPARWPPYEMNDLF